MSKNVNFFGVVLILFIKLLVNCAGIKPNPQFNEEPDAGPFETNEAPQERYSQTYRSDSSESRLQEQIDTYLGVPYKWGGTTKRGMDCSGFVYTVYKNAFGLKLPHNSKKMYSLGKRISVSQLQYGDLVFFENIGATGVSHVGIYIGESRFAHTSTKKGVMISNLNQKYYNERYVGARRVYLK